MTLSDLALQYTQTAAKLALRVKELNKAAHEMPSVQRIVLKRRIATLCYDISECRRIAKELAKYSKKGEEQ